MQNNLTVRQSTLTAQHQEADQRQNRAAMLPTANVNGTQVWNYGTSRYPLTNEFQNQTTRGQ